MADGARILQLAPGSTDLKTAQAIALTDIAAGDRVLVNGKAGDDASSFTASRVILMKSSDIAQKHEAEQADWQKRGTRRHCERGGCGCRHADDCGRDEEDRGDDVAARRSFGAMPATR